MRVGVIMGGISAEREVSLKTGDEIVHNLNQEKYDIYPIILNSKMDLLEKVKGIDVAFLALHGNFGEDGTVQSILEALNVPYTGCGVLSSALCMDKDITKRIVREAGIKTADWIVVHCIEEIDYEQLEKIGYPVVVKPNSGGSSVATAIINDRDDVEGAVKMALKYDKEVMIEGFIKGDEITCSILNGNILPVLAIKPKSSFFDYTSKYSDNGADEYVIELEPELNKQVQQMASLTYKLMKCSVYARVDIIVSNGVPYFLEVNTLPGMTRNSLIPKSAQAAGISFDMLLDKIIDSSLMERR